MMFPDYSIYPDCDYDVGFTTRGCIRSCPFCFVPGKEGRFRIHQHPKDFHDPSHKWVKLLDNNILADKDWFFVVTDWIMANNLGVEFNQGLDIRLLDKDIADRIRQLHIVHTLHFAFDHINYRDDVEKGIELLSKQGVRMRNVGFYVYVGGDAQFDDALERCNILRDHGTTAYVMLDPEKGITQRLRDLKRWSNPMLFYKTAFEDYDRNVRTGRTPRRTARCVYNLYISCECYTIGRYLSGCIYMTNQKMIGAIVGAVIQAVVVLAVGVPIIQSAQFQPKDVENDPLAYTVYMKGSDIGAQAFAVTSQDGIKTTYQNIDYDVQTECTSLLISDGINAVINGSSMDIYCPDGKKYASQTSVTKTADGTQITVTDANGDPHEYDLPSFCYLNVGKSDAAKTVQTNGIYKTNDKTTLDGSSDLVMVGLTDGILAVSGQSTVVGMTKDVTGGIIINPAKESAGQTTSKAIESEVDVGGNRNGYNVDGGTITGVVA